MAARIGCTTGSSRQQARTAQSTYDNKYQKNLHEWSRCNITDTVTHKPTHTLLTQQIGKNRTIGEQQSVDTSDPREKHKDGNEQEI